MVENSPTPSSTDDEAAVDHRLQRRSLFRGAAVLAGTAGVALAALNQPSAAAADGDTVKVGGSHRGSSPTGLTITPGEDPVLELTNTNGPALRLNLLPESWNGALEPGDLVATATGPLTVVDYGNGPRTTFLATGVDLAATPVPLPVSPRRLLDTRSRAGREAILRASSASAVDARGRLTGGSWIDVAVGSAEGAAVLSAAFVNVTAVAPVAGGNVTVYAPGPRPGVSTLNLLRGSTLANAAFVALGVVYQDEYIVRIHTTTTTYLLLDLSGVVVALNPLGAEGGGSSSLTGHRAGRQAKRAAALRKSLAGA